MEVLSNIRLSGALTEKRTRAAAERAYNIEVPVYISSGCPILVQLEWAWDFL